MAQKAFTAKSIQPMNLSPELEEVQPYFPISPDDRERLKRNIIETGEIRDPIKVYYNDHDECLILGGKNRWEIARELNWTVVPVEVYNLKPRERKELVLMDNLARRHLTSDQKRKVVEMFLRNDPVQSNVAIAKKTGVDDKTVNRVRRDLETTSEIPRLEKRVGSDGKARKSTIESRPKGTSENPRLGKAGPAAAKAKAPAPPKRDKFMEKALMSDIVAYAAGLVPADRAKFRTDLLAFIKQKMK